MTAVARCAADCAATTGGSSLSFLVVLGVMAWFFLQARTSRRVVWEGRAAALKPLVMHLAADAVAVYQFWHPHILRLYRSKGAREAASREVATFDEEIDQLLRKHG